MFEAGRRSLFGLLCLLPLTAGMASAQSDRSDFKFDRGIIEIEPGRKVGSGTAILSAENLAQDKLAPEIGLVDLADHGSPEVTLQSVQFSALELPAGPSSRSWLLTGTVSGLPINASQRRYLTFEFGGRQFVLPYTLTNRPGGQFEWTVRAPPAELSLGPGEAVEFGISVGPVPATDVRLLQVGLVEATTKQPLGKRTFKLCASRSGNCTGAALSLAAHSAQRLWLRSESEGSSIVGKYVGTIIVAAAEKPGGDPFNLTINGTNDWRRALGILTIFLGVSTAFATTYMARSLMNRAQALRPVTALSEKIATLRLELERPQGQPALGETPNINVRLETVAEDLSESKIDEYLPQEFPLPWSSTAPDAVSFKKYLTERADTLSSLDVLVDGVRNARSEFRADSPKARQQRVEKAVRDIDKLASGVLDKPADADRKVDAILDELRAALSPAAAETVSRSERTRTTFEQLRVEIRGLSFAVWTVYLLLTTAVGAYVLVFSNMAFGLPLDYFLCLFWGFALPTGGQLLQATPRTVATILDIPVPK